MRTIRSIAKPRTARKPPPNVVAKEKKPMGRPRIVGAKCKRHLVYLEAEDVKRALLIGEGNLSLGVRIAIRNLRVKDTNRTIGPITPLPQN